MVSPPADEASTLHFWCIGDLHFDAPAGEHPRIEVAGKEISFADIVEQRNEAMMRFARRKDTVPPDVIVAVGDIGDRGSRTGLERGIAYLAELAAAFPVPPAIMVVPGNHDVRIDTTKPTAGSPFHPGAAWFYERSSNANLSTPATPATWFSTDAVLFCPMDTTAWVGAALRARGSVSNFLGRALGKSAMSGTWAPGVLQQDMRDHVTRGLRQADDALRLRLKNAGVPATVADRTITNHPRLRIGVMHHPVIPHAGESVPRDIVDDFIAGGAVREWLYASGFSLLISGHRHQEGATEELPLLANPVPTKKLALLTLPAHTFPSFPFVIGEVLVGGRVHSGLLHTQIARRQGDSYVVGALAPPVTLCPPRVAVWQQRLRRTVQIEENGEAAVEIVMEGLNWDGDISPYVEEHEHRLKLYLDELRKHYSRIACLRFDISWPYGVIVREPTVDCIGTTDAEALIGYDSGVAFSEQTNRQRIDDGLIFIGTNAAGPVDLVFRTAASNAYATTRQELVWLEGEKRGVPRTAYREGTWQQIRRHCEVLEIEVRFHKRSPIPSALSQFHLDKTHPSARPGGRKTFRLSRGKLETEPHLRDGAKAIAAATFENPVPCTRYELEWTLPDVASEGDAEAWDGARLRLLEARSACRLFAIGQQRQPAVLQNSRAAPIVQAWLDGIFDSWSSFTEMPKRDLDISLFVPIVSFSKQALFDREKLRVLAEPHEHVRQDLATYEVPPMRLIPVASSISMQGFWDQVSFPYGQGLAGQAFRRNRAVYMDGFHPDRGQRIYQELMNGYRHHSLVCFALGRKPHLMRWPFGVLSFGVLSHGHLSRKIEEELSDARQRASLIARNQAWCREAGMSLASTLLKA